MGPSVRSDPADRSPLCRYSLRSSPKGAPVFDIVGDIGFGQCLQKTRIHIRRIGIEFLKFGKSFDCFGGLCAKLSGALLRGVCPGSWTYRSTFLPNVQVSQQGHDADDNHDDLHDLSGAAI